MGRHTKIAKLGIFPAKQVLRQVGPWTKEFVGEDDNTYSVNMDTKRYRLFCRSRVCVCCGLMGNFFRLESENHKTQPPDTAYFNLYAIMPGTGGWVLMTKDHIVPRSKGGSNNLSNYQTMCTICNGIRGDNDVLTMDEIRAEGIRIGKLRHLIETPEERKRKKAEQKRKKREQGRRREAKRKSRSA